MSKSMTAPKMSTATMVRVAVLAGLAFALTFLKVNPPIFPEFLDLELSDVPGLIALMAFGTIPSIFVLLIKNVLMLLKTSSAGIGELANFVIRCAYLIPMGLIYHRLKNNHRFLIGAVAGTVCMTLVAMLFNYFILIPAYTTVLEIPMEAILGMAQAVNSNVTDLGRLIVYAIAPFNILIAALFSVCSYWVYRALKPALRSS